MTDPSSSLILPGSEQFTSTMDEVEAKSRRINPWREEDPKIALLMFVKDTPRDLEYLKRLFHPIWYRHFVLVDTPKVDVMDTEIGKYLEPLVDCLFRYNREEDGIYRVDNLSYLPDFARARNLLIDRAENTYPEVEWAVSLDTDEQIDLKFKQDLCEIVKSNPDMAAARVQCLTLRDDPAKRKIEGLKMPPADRGSVWRFWRLRQGIRWHYAVHEGIYPSFTPEMRLLQISTFFLHHDYDRPCCEFNDEYEFLTRYQLGLTPEAHRLYMHLAGHVRHRSLSEAKMLMYQALREVDADDDENICLYAGLLASIAKSAHMQQINPIAPEDGIPVDRFATTSFPFGRAVSERDI